MAGVISMPRPHLNPIDPLLWPIIGLFGGIFLGIMIALILTFVDVIFVDWPNGQPTWGVIERGFSLGAIYYGLFGAVIGLIIGGCIGFAKWEEKKPRKKPF
jgi:hypothetical protein